MLENKDASDDTREQNAQIVPYLQRIYNTQAVDTRSREHIRERLLKLAASSLPISEEGTSLETTPAIAVQSQRTKEVNMQLIRSALHERKSWPQRLSAIAAAALVAIVVGALVLLFVQARQSNLGGGTGVFKVRPGWTQVALYSGTGSKTISKQDIQLPQVWGLAYTCVGSKFHMDLTGPGTIKSIGNDQCPSTPTTLLSPQSLNFVTLTPGRIQTIKVTANASTTWYVQIVREVPAPIFTPGSDWVPSIGIGGTGDSNPSGNVSPVTKPNGQVIHPKTWGIVFVCIGTGRGYIQLTPDTGRINLPTCDGQPRLKVVRYRYATDVQNVQAFINGSDIVWTAQLMACANEQKC